jgi:signal transduction histidine kinase
VVGSTVLLSQLLTNLFDNAVHHNQPTGTIAVTTEIDGPIAGLSVENDGPTIDADEADRLVEPFRRLGVERTGSENGVGLEASRSSLRSPPCTTARFTSAHDRKVG